MPVLTESIVRRVGGGGASLPQAYKLPYLGSTGYAVHDPNGLLSSISDQGSGKTRVTLDNTATGLFSAASSGLVYMFDAVDIYGDAMSGQHVLYEVTGGVRATATDGGPLPTDVIVALVLFEPESSPDFSATCEAFGGGLLGITGGLAGPVGLAQRVGWHLTQPNEATKGDASTRVCDWEPRLAASAAGITGYSGTHAISRASWADGSDTPQRLADYLIENAGDVGDSYTRLGVVISSAAILGGGTGTTAVDVECWFRARPRARSLRDSGFGS